MQSPACHKPSLRSSPGQTAPASRSETAMRPRRRENLVSSVVNLPDELNLIAVDQRLQLLLEVPATGTRYFCGNPQLHPGCLCNSDGDIGSFFMRQTSEEGQIVLSII